ncbi:MAG: SusD/RagB family nutrient-binding outer membrane lipoprotein [Parabacteroides sp.]|nr:SusD/RagB family nutrient-binding outer membrane lipoprotein [Parabacteroides sp.]
MKKIFSSLLISLALVSCGDFDEVNLNPDTPTTVTPDFLATRIILKTTESDNGKWFISDSWLMKTTSFTEHMEWFLYNKFERDNFKSYYHLMDAQKMLELAEANTDMSEEDKNAYRALNHFIRSYIFYGATMSMGDVPCSEAIKGEKEGIFSPKYDTQEEVFATILKELREASELFAKASTLNGDPVFGGDVSTWQRTVNSFTLRVLNMLSKKQTVGDMNVRSLFEQVAAEPLMRSEADSYQRVYDAGKSAQWYPFYYEKQNFWSYPVMTSFMVDMMKNLGDKRLFFYAEPAPDLSSNPGDSFDAYSGVNPVLEYGQVQAEFTKGLHSPINKRYYRVAEGEPVKFIAYSELQFILAEAALRGWKTPSSAKEHYENGVRAAMNFTTENTPEEYRHGATIDAAYVDDYLNGKAKFDAKNGLEQIMTQKLIGSFFQLKFNSYYDYRRTGYPRVPIDPATNMNEVKTQLPIRWMYPDEEYSQNRTNIEEAIQRQFGGNDTPNDVMWLLK